MTLQADYRAATFPKQICEASFSACTVKSTLTTVKREVMHMAAEITSIMMTDLCCALFKWLFSETGFLYSERVFSATRGQQRLSVITQLPWLEKVCYLACVSWWPGGLTYRQKLSQRWIKR